MKKKPRAKHVSATPGSAVWPLLRVFLLAAVGVLASVYGVWRHYTVQRPPMVVPRPPPTEIPVEME